MLCCELGLLHGLVDLELPHEVCGVSVGSVGGVVKSHVGHRTVEVRCDDLLLDLLHGLHLHCDDRLHGFDGVVGVSELEGVCTEGPLVDKGGLEPAHVDSVSGVSVVSGEVELSDVVGEDDFVSGLDCYDPVLVADDVCEPLDVVCGQCGDGSHVCRVGGSGLEVCHDLLFGHGDPLSVTHPCVEFLCCHWISFFRVVNYVFKGPLLWRRSRKRTLRRHPHRSCHTRTG